MTGRQLVLVGGPDSGKTNFIGALWIALRAGAGVLRYSATPENIKYVEDAVAHLYQGGFAPRSDKNLELSRGTLTVPLGEPTDSGIFPPHLVIPDVSGEVWQEAVETLELDSGRMASLNKSTGCLLFLRVHSPLNVMPLDWVNASGLMEYQAEGDFVNSMPTQVMLCEFLRFLEISMTSDESGSRPKVAIIIAAWDLLDEHTSRKGPEEYLKATYPLFYGKLVDTEALDIQVFSTSIFGVDPTDPDALDMILESDIKSLGYVRYMSGDCVEEVSDFTLPVAWAAGLTDLF